MKLNANALVLDIKGRPIRVPDPAAAPGADPALVDLSYADVFIQALTTQVPSEELSGEQKVVRFKLAMKVQDADASGQDLDLTPEEAVEIKRAVGKIYMPTVVGRVFTLIDAS